MRAVLLESIGQPLRLSEDHAEPHVVDGAELIEVSACGVCHSDIHVADGDFGGPLPLILGHEVTGLHAELGPVMVYAPWGCRSCRECNDGLEMMCASGTEAGMFADGGYAERMLVKHRRYLAPLGDLDPVASAPLACGGLTAYRAVVHTLETLRNSGPAARALVIGAGGLGQFAIRFLRLLTNAEVVALDTMESKRVEAVAVGAHEAVAPGVDAGLFDVVIDFLGVQATLDTAAASVARRGLVIVVGLGSGTIPFGFRSVAFEARFMSSVWGSRTELDELLDFARREPSIIQPVEAVPLGDAQHAHERLRAGDVRGRLVLVP